MTMARKNGLEVAEPLRKGIGGMAQLDLETALASQVSLLHENAVLVLAVRRELDRESWKTSIGGYLDSGSR